MKKKMFDGGTIKELSDRRHFIKPSERKRKKKLEAIRQNQRLIKKEKLKYLQGMR
jgi:ribosomal protein S21